MNLEGLLIPNGLTPSEKAVWVGYIGFAMIIKIIHFCIVIHINLKHMHSQYI